MIEDEVAIITGASPAAGKATARLPARLAIGSERNDLHVVSNDVDGVQQRVASCFGPSSCCPPAA